MNFELAEFQKPMVIPNEIQLIINKLKKHGFDAYIVGGCVRDLLQNKEPNDWDITTNAKPEEIQKIFPKSFEKENAMFSLNCPSWRFLRFFALLNN